ncbi:MAG: catalase family peroxidase [Kofleriaceae bacterium]
MTTSTYSPAQLVEALHCAFGDHHARAVHAKGIVLAGTFQPDPRAAELTVAAHLQRAPSAVVVRFTDFTGIPEIPDDVGAANPRGFAIRFEMPEGGTTDIVAHSFDGFPAATSDEFRELLVAVGASGDGAPHPTPLEKFLDTHPIARTFLTTQKTPASYATISYFGVNAFRFTNASGDSRHVRYQVLPERERLLSAGELAHRGPNYLRDEIAARVARGRIRFSLVAQLAEPGDAIADPSIAWPASRTKVPLGVVELTELAANTAEQDRALGFAPSAVPRGIEPADPMLAVRARAYPISVGERQ